MEALVERLSQLDSRAEGAVRIVMFYDTLMRRRVDLSALVRASANLSECVVGTKLSGTQQTIRMSTDGSPAGQESSTISAAAPVVLDDEEIGTVWLERSGDCGALDELLLDRLAIAVAAVVERYGPARTTMADPALVELAISADSDDAAQARALRLLGFSAHLPVRVVAVASSLRLDKVGSAVGGHGLVKAAPLADVGVILATTVDANGFPSGVRAGIGASRALDECWRQARTALRFTGRHEPVVDYEDLGAVALLAEVAPELVGGNADVAAVAAIANNLDDLETLDAFCVGGSVRRAAELLHRHHSSVARRLRQLGKALGFEVTEPAGLVRVKLALAAWRIRHA